MTVRNRTHGLHVNDGRNTQRRRDTIEQQSRASLPAGTVLDERYRLEAVIAHGGMSTVYLATDLRLDRHVAVKVLSAELAHDRQFLDRFTLEAKSVARLSHPGLVAVYDQGHDSRGAFLVMEVVPGGTLRELLDERGPMPPHAVLAVLTPILGALATAHKSGLLHRDIKPENILISDAGEVKLADFGLVRAVAASRATSQNVILGTAAYLSPEQVKGEQCDSRSDLYSLGLVTFEMLTGRPPYSAEDPLSLAYQRVHRDVSPPSLLVDGIPEDLDDLIVYSTERDPQSRIADADTMLAAIRAISERHSYPRYIVPSPRESAWSRAREKAALNLQDDSALSEFDRAEIESSGDVLDPEGNSENETSVVGEPQSSPSLTSVLPAMPSELPNNLPSPPASISRAWPPQPTVSQQPSPYPSPHRSSETALLQPRQEQNQNPASVPIAELRRKSRRANWAWIAILLVLAVVIAVVTWWMASGRYTHVPYIAGYPTLEAARAVTDAGLEPNIETLYSNEVPRDVLLGSTPEQGSRVVRGARVVLIVSAGQPEVPEIPGDRRLESVQAELQSRQLIASTGPPRYSDDIPEGLVLSLSPPPGTTVAVGDTVTVISSSGPAPMPVPSLAGLSEDQARTAIAAAGFEVGSVERIFDPEVDGGEVIESAPASGTEIARGSQVSLTVSSAVTVPDIVGRDEESAESILAEAGLTAVLSSRETDASVPEGHVVRTEPPAGGRVDSNAPLVRVVLSNSVKVPFLLGRTVSSARQALNDAGLQASLTGATNGIVYGQVPLPGATVARGAAVKVNALG